MFVKPRILEHVILIQNAIQEKSALIINAYTLIGIVLTFIYSAKDSLIALNLLPKDVMVLKHYAKRGYLNVAMAFVMMFMRIKQSVLQIVGLPLYQK